MNKRNIIIMCFSITIVVFVVFVYYIINIYNKHESNISENIIKNDDTKIEIKNTNIISTSSKEDIKLSPSAILEIKQYYKQCGHMISEKCNIPKDIVNMNENDIKKYYDGWQIDEFKENKIVIYSERNDICNEHYIVKESNGYVSIFNKNKNGEEQFIKNTEILTKYLPDEDKEKLKDGVLITGKEKLDQFLEDFE